MLRLFVAVVAAASLALAHGASAAEVSSWSGWYGGVNVGGAWSDVSKSRAFNTPNCLPGSNCFAPQQANMNSISPDLNAGNFTGGVQAGYNWSFGQFVAGLEADLNYLDYNKTVVATRSWPGGGPGFSVKTATSTDSITAHWVGTLRPRIGYLVTPQMLLYATGGLAFSDQKYSNATTIFATGQGANTGIYNSSATKEVGTVVGGGIEYALLRNMTVKAEYQHLWFNNPNAVGGNTAPQATDLTNSSLVASPKVQMDIVRVGANWKLGANSPELAHNAYASAAEVYSWGGWYGGVNLGGAWGDVSKSRAFNTPNCPPGNNCFAPQQANMNSISPDLNAGNFTGGVQAGYNWSFGQFVAGVEADLNYLDYNKTVVATRSWPGGGGGGSVKTATSTDSITAHWVGTLRPRIGYLVTPQMLLYATGGLAFSDQKYSNATTIFVSGQGTNTGIYNSSATKEVGTVVGGGIEYAWSRNMTVKAEYQHLWFNNPNAVGGNTAPISTDLNNSSLVASPKVQMDIVRVGANWKF